MKKHTPGPWGVYHLGTSEGNKINTFEHRFEIVTPNTVEAMGSATASLIAAAPDLLKCVEHALNELEQSRKELKVSVAEWNGYESVKMFKAAIKKARGL
jgi:hypothetical protein